MGRGDVLSPLADRPRRWVVVATPTFGVSTKDAYRWFDEADTATPHVGRPFQGRRKVQGRQPLNDLQPPVVAHHPQVGQLIDELRRQGASPAVMTGSGSAVFGLFARISSAEAAADALVGHGRRVLVTKTLSRAEHRRLSRPVLARK